MVVQEWEKYANIKFDCVKSQDAIIRITFDPHDGSWSFIGRDILTAKSHSPTMNLSWVEDSEDISMIDKGIILHEFGHTLGLGHEQDMESIMMYVLCMMIAVDAIKSYFTPFIGILCQLQ
jgi:hypothetical protein